ncbi:sigma factor-like helix-turn-helix DNA-binding protein [Paenibacillus contaminans]|uniref:RNA polymerase sigma-70 region 4 domain-containing protein n=1 Tax=Paenibacillus contaminans TaxID=450362 RepID=A0A329MTF5_9BACL|nr:sigma factor-like helix-turn-helix DNA-binding protein [Paenibacillus contaminans]RAV22666.1 hypothetical protein DQG23_00145 [Paenibacillus contaminans]
MKKEQLEQIQDIRLYQEHLVKQILENYYDCYETAPFLRDVEIVVNKADIDMAISLLEPKERFVICYYYKAGYNINEIANELGHTEGYVSKIKNKAFKKIVDYCLF